MVLSKYINHSTFAWGQYSFSQLVFGPLVFIHPSKEHKDQLRQGLSLLGELRLPRIKILNKMVGYIDNVVWPLCLPESLSQIAVDFLSDVVDEAG